MDICHLSLGHRLTLLETQREREQNMQMLTETRVSLCARDWRLDQSQSDGTTCVCFTCLERWNEALLYFLIHIEKEWCERVYARCPFHSCESSCVRVYICGVQNNLIISIRFFLFFFFASLSHVRWYARVQLAATISVALMLNLFMFHCRSLALWSSSWTNERMNECILTWQHERWRKMPSVYVLLCCHLH
jgi:hypothetical protein